MIERPEQAQRFFDGQLVGKLRLLKLNTEPLPQLALVLLPRETEDLHVPSVGFEQSLEDFDRRRLAGAVRAKQSEALAAADAQREAVDRHDISVTFDEIGATHANHEQVSRRLCPDRTGVCILK